jgi:hypothetical protein
MVGPGARLTRLVAVGLLVSSLLVWSGACSSVDAGRSSYGFSARSIELCTPVTTSIPVRTREGGVLVLELVDACGEVRATCESTEVYGREVQATIRYADTRVGAGACLLSATGSTHLRAVFVDERNTAAEESYEISLRGSCLDAAAACP